MSRLRPFVYNIPLFFDERGSLLKFQDRGEFLIPGFSFKFVQSFVSFSKTAVIRGMHFQSGSSSSDRCLLVLKGVIRDLLVRIPELPTFAGQLVAPTPYESILAEHGLNFIFIPKSFAHGFEVIEDAVLLYFFENSYEPSEDSGFHYDSFGFTWSELNPIVSQRDRSLPSFSSLFGYSQ